MKKFLFFFASKFIINIYYQTSEYIRITFASHSVSRQGHHETRDKHDAGCI